MTLLTNLDTCISQTVAVFTIKVRNKAEINAPAVISVAGGVSSLPIDPPVFTPSLKIGKIVSGVPN